MDFVAEFVLVIFATTRAKLFQYDCNNTIVNMLAAVASGLNDLQELQYCVIDDCTIMRTDTGHQLDIACTTQRHLLVATPTDGRSSPRMNPQSFAFPLMLLY